jgi:hypothetical protein
MQDSDGSVQELYDSIAKKTHRLCVKGELETLHTCSGGCTRIGIDILISDITTFHQFWLAYRVDKKVSKLLMDYDNHTPSLAIQCTLLISYINVTTNNYMYEIMPVIINLLGRSSMIKNIPFQFVNALCNCLANSTLCLFLLASWPGCGTRFTNSYQHGPNLRVVALVNKISIS